MAKFTGSTNLNLGGPEPWVSAVYDPDSREYVIEVTGDNLKKFRDVADGYGFTEVKASKSEKDDKDA